ncbi:MAG: ABC transporter permease [Chloroflexota bacterium]|nr:ABC transporter permease [Chloroflexota bacterium]
MSGLRLAAGRARLENRVFWRNPTAAFFTIVFPLVFLLVADVALAGPLGGRGQAARFYTPSIMAFGLITACYTSLAMGVVLAREAGTLKRLRGTPLPTWAYVAGRIGQPLFVAALLATLIGLYGALVHGLTVPLERLPLLLVALTVGALSFSALGLAITAAVPNAGAAPAFINATILPLLLISDVLVPLDQGVLATIAGLFPVRHLADALRAAYDPTAALAAGEGTSSILVVGAWGLAGLFVALRSFSWSPRG